MARNGFSPDSAAMPLNDVLDDDQADARALELILIMQAAELSKEVASGVAIKTNAIIPDEKDLFGLVGIDANLDKGDGTFARVFESIAEQIDQDLPNHGEVPGRFRKGRNLPGHFAIGSQRLQFVAH